MKVLHLRESIPWFGSHSGYEQLTRFLAADQEVWTVKPRSGPLARYFGSTCARLQGRPGRGATDSAELEFRLLRKWRRPDVSHLLYLDYHLDLLAAWEKVPKDLVGTVHLPPSVWKPEQLKLLSRLISGIALYQRDLPFFEKIIGKGNVRFIHHGVDTDFFKPDNAKRSAAPRILYSGVYLRNEAMLVRVIERLVKTFSKLRFDLLVPQHHRNSPALASLRTHPAVTWQGGLNDEQLRDLYQQSHLMVLPMNDSGANTAVVESLASGLPVVSTDVGGIRDYGGDTIFPVIKNNDDDAMIALIEQYISRPAWAQQIGQNCRAFAETTLAWPIIAQQHVDFYRQLVA